MGNLLTNILAPRKAADKAREARRNLAIAMYCGRNGAGKTLCMIYDTIPDLEAGTKVLSTVRLIDYNDPRPCEDDECLSELHGQEGHLAAHPSYIPLISWHQVLEFENGVILLDEITGIADSSEGSSIPSAVNNLFAQLRRRNVVVRITGLSFIRANKRIREAVIGVIRCQSFMPVEAFDNDGNLLAWKRRRLSVMTTYDAQTLPVDDHTENAYEKADKLNKSRVWIPDSPATKVYDTYAQVLRVGHVSDAGRCVYCDGQRRVQECKCSDYVALKAEGREARSARAVPEHRSSRSASRTVSETHSETDCSCDSHAA
jgi:hypothetical protein